MKITQRLLWIMAASACLLAAQDDPPGRIARLSYVYHAVSFLPAGESDWGPADFNRPLTTGDQVFVDFTGTAELQTGSAVLRLGSQTTMEFLNLDDNNVQLRMTGGTLLVRLRDLGDQDSFEVDTPYFAFTLLRPGEYRIDVKPDRDYASVTVRSGSGELTGPSQAFTVRPGEQTQVSGLDQPSYRTLGAPDRDTLDNFAYQRDQNDDQSASARYCSRDLVGYQDLDRYGSWRNTQDYGNVWVPNDTPAGWAPYHFGHWLWVDPWGWTWVDDAPWGFAPSHYGRWAYVGNYWGWVPGPVAERPVYAPALVAWVGGGSIGGGVAWFALGPREVYVPSYHTSERYANRVNVSNTVIVNNINITNYNTTNVNYRNRNAPGAVMAVQRDAFAGARPVQSAAINVRPDAFRSAPVVASAAVAPTRASILRGPAAGARVAQPPAAMQRSAVFARKTPPPPPVPFAQKQAALAANPGRPLDVQQVQQLRQNQPAPARNFVRQVQARPVTPAGQAPAQPSNQPGGQPPARTFDRGNTQQQPQAAPPATPQQPFDRRNGRAPRTDVPAPPAAAPAQAQPPAAPAAPDRNFNRRNETPAPPAAQPAQAPAQQAAPPRGFERRNDTPAPPAAQPAQAQPPAAPERNFNRRNDTPTPPAAQPAQPPAQQAAPPRGFERRNNTPAPPAAQPAQQPAPARSATPPPPPAAAPAPAPANATPRGRTGNERGNDRKADKEKDKDKKDK
jgi:hypothetical protein